MGFYEEGTRCVKRHTLQERQGWPGWLGIGLAMLIGVFGCSALGWAQEGGTGTASEPTRLDPMVVTATRTEIPLSQVGSTLTVITTEELEQRQIRIVSDALREVPGLAVNRGGGVGQFTQIRIRGAEANHTLVLIDGIEVNDPAAGSEFDFAQLLASDIERIEILRGPQSVLYGSDAIGGVVNIITKRGRGRPTFTGSLEGGSFGTGQANASVSGGSAQYHFLLSGVGFHTDGISVASERRGNTEADREQNVTVFGKLGWSPLDFLALDFVGRYTGFRTEGDGFDFISSIGAFGAVDADTETKGEQFFGRAQAKLTLCADRWEHILGFAYTEHDRDNFVSGVKDSRFKGSKHKFDYQTNLYLATPELAQARHTLTFAFDAEWEEVVSRSAFIDIDRNIDTRGFVGQYQLSLLDRVFLSAGLRYDYNDLFEDSTTYRVTAAYRHKETGTKLKTSYGTGVKNPTVFELFGFTPTFQGNPNLQAEEGWGWDIGVEQALFDSRLLLDVIYFDQRIDQLIVGAGQTAVNLDGESRSYGVEVAVTLTPMSGLDLRGTYTYTHTRDANGNELVRRPQHMGSVDLNYRFFEDRANVNLGVIYNGSQGDFAFDAFFNRSIVRLGSYTLVNLAASYQVTHNVQLFARAENLLDDHYEEVFTFGAPGRAGYAGVRVRF